VNAMEGQIDLAQLPNVQQRVAELKAETTGLLAEINQLGQGKSGDPLADASTLADAVKTGILDAPQLVNNPFARGEVQTMIDSRGACIEKSGQEMDQSAVELLINN